MKTKRIVNLVILSSLASPAVAYEAGNKINNKNEENVANNISEKIAYNLDDNEDQRGEPHLYVGAKAGYNYFSSFCNSNDERCDASNVAYALFGGVQLMPWFALQLDATDYQRYDARNSLDTSTLKMQGYSASLKFSQPVPLETLAGYLRLGGSYNIVKDSNPSPSFEKRSWSPLGALGIEYKITPTLTLQAEFQYINDIAGYRNDSHFTSLGISYHFGGNANSGSTVVQQSSKQSLQKQQEDIKLLAVPVMNESIVKAVNNKSEIMHPDPKEIIETVQFGFGSTEISTDTKAALDKILRTRKQYPNVSVILIGHTDSVSSRKGNQILSEKRAMEVAKYLSKNGINRESIVVKGKGEDQPIASNQTPEGRKLNRRVEVFLTEVH